MERRVSTAKGSICSLHLSQESSADSEICVVRTFTVSSSASKLPVDEFEITIRNTGTVTNFLFRQNLRGALQVPLKGFGGSFTIKQGPKEIIPFVAGGIGITSLLAQLPDLELARVRLFWTINIHDTGLVIDTVERCPGLGPSTRIFISKFSEQSPAESNLQIQKLEGYGVHVATERMVASDIERHSDLSSTWYLCTGTALRKSLLAWLYVFSDSIFPFLYRILSLETCLKSVYSVELLQSSTHRLK